MRTGCLVIVLVLVGFTSFGLYLSWGYEVLILFLALVAGGFMYLFYRQKKQDLVEKEAEQTEEPFAKEASFTELSLQDPDKLLQQFRSRHKEDTSELENHTVTSTDQSFSNLQADEEAAFNRAVEELKKVRYADDSIRMQWIRSLENYTKNEIIRLQNNSNSVLEQRLIALFISRSFVYVRVLVNLLDISVKMDRLNDTYSKQLESRLVSLSTSDFERITRIISLHLLDLFLSDHVTTLLFDDQFTKRKFTQIVINGLQFSKKDTDRLANVTTDTEVMQLLLSEFQLDQTNRELIDLAKTAFENVADPLKDEISSAIKNLSSRT